MALQPDKLPTSSHPLVGGGIFPVSEPTIAGKEKLNKQEKRVNACCQEIFNKMVELRKDRDTGIFDRAWKIHIKAKVIKEQVDELGALGFSVREIDSMIHKADVLAAQYLLAPIEGGEVFKEYAINKFHIHRIKSEIQSGMLLESDQIAGSNIQHAEFEEFEKLEEELMVRKEELAQKKVELRVLENHLKLRRRKSVFGKVKKEPVSVQVKLESLKSDIRQLEGIIKEKEVVYSNKKPEIYKKLQQDRVKFEELINKLKTESEKSLEKILNEDTAQILSLRSKIKILQDRQPGLSPDHLIDHNHKIDEFNQKLDFLNERVKRIKALIQSSPIIDKINQLKTQLQQKEAFLEKVPTLDKLDSRVLVEIALARKDVQKIHAEIALLENSLTQTLVEKERTLLEDALARFKQEINSLQEKLVAKKVEIGQKEKEIENLEAAVAEKLQKTHLSAVESEKNERDIGGLKDKIKIEVEGLKALRQEQSRISQEIRFKGIKMGLILDELTSIKVDEHIVRSTTSLYLTQPGCLELSESRRLVGMKLSHALGSTKFPSDDARLLNVIRRPEVDPQVMSQPRVRADLGKSGISRQMQTQLPASIASTAAQTSVHVIDPNAESSIDAVVRDVREAGVALGGASVGIRVAFEAYKSRKSAQTAERLRTEVTEIRNHQKAIVGNIELRVEKINRDLDRLKVMELELRKKGQSNEFIDLIHSFEIEQISQGGPSKKEMALLQFFLENYTLSDFEKQDPLIKGLVTDILTLAVSAHELYEHEVAIQIKTALLEDKPERLSQLFTVLGAGAEFVGVTGAHVNQSPVAAAAFLVAAYSGIGLLGLVSIGTTLQQLDKQKVEYDAIIAEKEKLQAEMGLLKMQEPSADKQIKMEGLKAKLASIESHQQLLLEIGVSKNILTLAGASVSVAGGSMGLAVAVGASLTTAVAATGIGAGVLGGMGLVLGLGMLAYKYNDYINHKPIENQVKVIAKLEEQLETELFNSIISSGKIRTSYKEIQDKLAPLVIQIKEAHEKLIALNKEFLSNELTRRTASPMDRLTAALKGKLPEGTQLKLLKEIDSTEDPLILGELIRRFDPQAAPSSLEKLSLANLKDLAKSSIQKYALKIVEK